MNKKMGKKLKTGMKRKKEKWHLKKCTYKIIESEFKSFYGN